MKTRTAVAAALLVLTAIPAALAGQASPPEYTDRERWERAGMHVSLFMLLMVREGMAAGKTPAQIGESVAEVFGEGWSGTSSPEEMTLGIRHNLMMWPGAEVEVSGTADRAILRANRPWAAVFDGSTSLAGVAPDDIEATLGAFHAAVARSLGWTFEQRREGEDVVMTIARR